MRQLYTIVLLSLLFATAHFISAIIPPPPPIGVPPPPIKPIPPLVPPPKPLPLALNAGDLTSHPQQRLVTFTVAATPTDRQLPENISTDVHTLPAFLDSQRLGESIHDKPLRDDNKPIIPPVAVEDLKAARAEAVTASLVPLAASNQQAQFTTMQFPPAPIPGLGGPGLGGPAGGLGGLGGLGGAGGGGGGANPLLSSLDSALNTITQLLDRLNQNGGLSGGGNSNPVLAGGSPVNIPISGSNGVSVGDSLPNLQPINAGTPNLPVPDF